MHTFVYTDTTATVECREDYITTIYKPSMGTERDYESIDDDTECYVVSGSRIIVDPFVCPYNQPAPPHTDHVRSDPYYGMYTVGQEHFTTIKKLSYTGSRYQNHNRIWCTTESQIYRHISTSYISTHIQQLTDEGCATLQI